MSAITTNGAPRRSARPRRKLPPPLRARLGPANSPESKNISDMKKVSLKSANRSKTIRRWLSTIGTPASQGCWGLGRRGGADERVGEHRVMRHHKHRDERAQSVERCVAARGRVRMRSARHGGEDRPCRPVNASRRADAGRAGGGVSSAFLGFIASAAASFMARECGTPRSMQECPAPPRSTCRN